MLSAVYFQYNNGSDRAYNSKYLSASASSIRREESGSQVKELTLRTELEDCDASTCQSFWKDTFGSEKTSN